MATRSRILTWEIPWAEAWWATIHGAAESDVTEQPSRDTQVTSRSCRKGHTVLQRSVLHP